MKIKKNYIYNNGKQIWRIIPSGDKVIIEERSTTDKEVFFSCLEINSGKKIFSDLQLDEKFWIGIEAIQDDVIYFHRYSKPDMPGHNGIIAFDINSKSILWENRELVFSSYSNKRLLCFKQLFEKKQFLEIDPITGKIIREILEDELLNFRNESELEFTSEGYLFPQEFNRVDFPGNEYEEYLQKYCEDVVIRGSVSYIIFSRILLFNYHEIKKENLLDNIFVSVDIDKEKILLKEKLNSKIQNLMPESFFIKNNLLFLLFEKSKFGVYSIIN